MFRSKLLSTLVLSAAILVPSASFAAQPERAPCILQEHKVTAVTPYKIQQPAGRGVTTRLAGARVFVQAERGLTAEWLQLEIAKHIASMKATMPECALDVKDVSVQVASAGTGFDVRISAKDSSKAAEILRRAQLLAR